MALLFAAIAVGFIWACIYLYVHDRRDARTWTDSDDRALELHVKGHQ
jgi:hypothetical protein